MKAHAQAIPIPRCAAVARCLQQRASDSNCPTRLTDRRATAGDRRTDHRATVASPTALAPTDAPSPTASPTEVSAPTQAPSPSPAAALAVLDQGFQVWCMPVDAPAAAVKSSAAPSGARIGVYKDVFKETQVVIPASTCTLAYTFNQALPADVTLEAHYFYGGAAWLTKPLTPAAENSTVGLVTFDQPDVVNPPLWQVSYQFVVKSGEKELRKDMVNFNKQVSRCWEGSLPDPVTLDCPHADSREPRAAPGRNALQTG